MKFKAVGLVCSKWKYSKPEPAMNMPKEQNAYEKQAQF